MPKIIKFQSGGAELLNNSALQIGQAWNAKLKSAGIYDFTNQPAMPQITLPTAPSISQLANFGADQLSSNPSDSLITAANNVGGKIIGDFTTKSTKISTDFAAKKAAAGITEGAAKSGLGAKINGMNSGMQAGLGAAGSALGALSTKGLTSEQASTREGIRSAIGSFGPWGAAIAAASGIIDGIGAATGLNLDNLDKGAAKKAGVGGAAGFNNIVNSLPGVSMTIGMWGGTTDKAYKSHLIDSVAENWGGATMDIDDAGKLGGKRTLFGKRKMNKFIAKQNENNRKITNEAQDQLYAKQTTYGQELGNQNQRRYSGDTGMPAAVGKNGMKLLPLDSIKTLLQNKRADIVINGINKFQEGGKMNVIAEGAMHIHNNHLDEITELEDVTKKGIPVIEVLEEGGELKQHAEIEEAELILTKELTDKLELLFKDGSDEAMVEAGKLLAEEIIENTDDKTGKVIDDENNN